MLTAKQKQIWILHSVEGVPQVEIAKRTGRCPESVCRLYRRADKAIRPLLNAFLAAGGSLAAFRVLL